MDPITAFSVACGVIQVVDFGLTAVKMVREIYRNGSLSQNQDIEYTTRNLNEASTSLEQSLKTPDMATQHSKDDVELRNLAVACQEASHELLLELEGLKIDTKKPSKRQAVEKGIKMFWKKSKIEKLQGRLEGYQSVLDSRILSRLYERFNASEIQQSDGFRDIGQAVQNLIVGLANHKTTMHDLLVAESTATRDHITQKLDQLQLQSVSEDQRKRFLNSLYFAQITSRQEQIPDAHEQTFQWIFDNSGQALQKWDNFMQWLEKGNAVYWINGKAGSGKSTLMNYICADPRTESALKIWASDEGLVIPKFFFWSAGNELQKSSVGLLRSLLHQILDHYPKLIGTIVPPQDEHKPLAAWTERRLLSTLQTVVRRKEISVKMCCFIDGLDEFDGSQTDLVDLIKSMSHDTKVKFCLSSRWSNQFEQAFNDSAKLKLQDLTYSDIKKFVADKLQEAPRMKQLQEQSPNLASSTTDQVVRMADGVFLWVRLAIRELLEGFSNEDSEEQLQGRLRLLPDAIEGFYIQMLGRLAKVYRKDAAKYFQLIEIEEMSLLGLTFAEDQIHGRDTTQYASGLEVGKISLRCNIMRTQLLMQCAGLLECIEDSSGRTENRTDFEHLLAEAELRRYNMISVRFLHRTARDFLLETEIGKAALNANTGSAFNPYVWHFWAQLMPYYTRLRQPYSPTVSKLRTLKLDLDKIMGYAFLAEQKAYRAQKVLMETLDRTIAAAFSWTEDWGRSAEEDCHPSDKEDCNKSGKSEHWITRLSLDGRQLNFFGSCFDFVGFAAYHGLQHFVLDSLNSLGCDKSMPDEGYLLGCALYMARTLARRHCSGYSELITSLVGRGANPNTIVMYGGPQSYSDHSAFEVFLKKVWEALLYYEGPLPAEWATITTVLLANGADAKTIIKDLESIEIVLPQLLPIDPADSTRLDHEITLCFELSAASLIKACLKNTPGYEKLEAHLQSQGVSQSRKVNPRQVFSFGGGQWVHVNDWFERPEEGAVADKLLEGYMRFLEDRSGRALEELEREIIEADPKSVQPKKAKPLGRISATSTYSGGH